MAFMKQETLRKSKLENIKINDLEKKVMIPESVISEYPEYEVK